MRIGVSLNSSYAVGDVRLGARWMIEQAAASRDAGLDSLFVGDHHNTGPRNYYQGVPIMGRLLAEWGDRPAGILMLLPLWHPVLAAEQVGTLAAIHSGRFILQAAVGPADEQFSGMGVDPKHRPSRIEEALDAMRRLWAGEQVSGGRRYQFSNVRIAPVPPEPVEVWLGGEVPAAIDRAARLGDGWLAAPGLTDIEAHEQSAAYRQQRRTLGRDPGAVAIRRDIFVGSDAEEALAVAGPIVERGYRGFDRSAVIFGDIDEVAVEMRRLAGMGFTDVIIRHLVPDQAQVLASTSRLARVRELVADA
ncbi:MAG: LLM class flavin-dependent oxidoreductase [Chloroflexi bacterium]|nr:LLM class flavin-dependent oxidoreductase [Chloroflexota bacterium]MDA1239839.1 LLM class flavin-dependent oxidoreductase [Chloroflexota bacterium]